MKDERQWDGNEQSAFIGRTDGYARVVCVCAGKGLYVSMRWRRGRHAEVMTLGGRVDGRIHRVREPVHSAREPTAGRRRTFHPNGHRTTSPSRAICFLARFNFSAKPDDVSDTLVIITCVITAQDVHVLYTPIPGSCVTTYHPRELHGPQSDRISTITAQLRIGRILIYSL